MDIDRLSIKKIIGELKIPLTLENYFDFFELMKQAMPQELIEEFARKTRENNREILVLSSIHDFLIRNEKYIDKEKLI